mgnify:FL=1
MPARSDTIFALATPPGRSAIAVIRITAMADRPGGVASAKIVSLRAGIDGFLSLPGCYRLIAAGNAHQGC